MSKMILKYLSIKNYYNYFTAFYLSLIKKYYYDDNYLINSIKVKYENDLEKIDYKIISDKFKVQFSESEKLFFKENIKQSKSIIQNYKTGYVHKSSFLSVHENVKYFGNSGAISINKQLVAESVFNKARSDKIKVVDSFFYKHKKMKGVYSSIMHLPWAQNNIYHWIIECIPRLYAISKINDKNIFLIINDDINQLQLETLKIFLDDRFTLLKITKNEVWELEKYYFASFVNDDISGALPVSHTNYIRNKVFKHYNIDKNSARDRRVYISRKKAPKRRILNEHGLIEILINYNFEIIYAEDLSFHEQVDLWNTTEIMISLPGAAWANSIFGSKIKCLILYIPDPITTHFITMCNSFGHTHTFFMLDKQEKSQDCYIDLDSFKYSVKHLIKS